MMVPPFQRSKRRVSFNRKTKISKNSKIKAEYFRTSCRICLTVFTKRESKGNSGKAVTNDAFLEKTIFSSRLARMLLGLSESRFDWSLESLTMGRLWDWLLVDYGTVYVSPMGRLWVHYVTDYGSTMGLTKVPLWDWLWVHYGTDYGADYESPMGLTIGPLRNWLWVDHGPTMELTTGRLTEATNLVYMTIFALKVAVCAKKRFFFCLTLSKWWNQDWAQSPSWRRQRS